MIADKLRKEGLHLAPSLRALFIMVGKAWRQEWIQPGRQKPEAAGHALYAVGKQRAMNEAARPFSSFLFSPLAQP